MLVHSPCCCVGVAITAKAEAGLWLLFLHLTALALQVLLPGGGPGTPRRQAPLPSPIILPGEGAWVFPTAGLQVPLSF